MALHMLRPTLPEKENGTYFILPKAGEPPQTGAERDAWQMVARINPAYLEFSKTERTNIRSMGLLMGSWGGGMIFLMCIPSVAHIWVNANEYSWDAVLVTSAVVAIALMVAIVVPRYQLRQPQSPILLSRCLRRFYQWQGKKAGWTALDYDHVVPYVTRGTIPSPMGTTTSFFLDVALLMPGTRKVAHFIRLSDPSMAVLPPAELWEFVRAYMDGPAAKVPPIEYRIPEGQEHGIHARMDRDLLPGLLDKEHRLKRGLFYKLYFGMLSMTVYWATRLQPWMERRIPRPPLPPELADAMQWEGENPYRVRPPSEIEQKAIDGQLPYMNRRWFVGMLLSTLLWGGSFTGMTLIGWQKILFGP
ncbi:MULTISPECIES: hypothetical protein [Cupriavidus]